MALSLVTNLLTTLQPLVDKEVVLLWGVGKEMTKLSSTLSTIEAVLEDAERNHQEDRAVQDWLQKLKDAAYEVDDILDECSTEILRWESKGQSSGSLKKVGTSLLYPFKNVIFRHRIGHMVKEISEKLAAIADERSKFHFRNMVVESRDEFTKSRETSSLLTLPELIGRNQDKEKIIKVLLEDALERDEEVSVYPIIGMGGLGKTTLAQAAFNDERMKIHFDLRIWVYVSQDFDLKRVIKSTIESISGDTCQVSDLDSLQKKLREMLNGKRFLIVLDDVWGEGQEKWDKLRYTIACGSKGSSIIVTTRVAKVVSIMGTLPTHYLSYLSEEDCWLLFKQRAFGNGNEERPNLVAIGKDIVKKCGGVPLAATALGGLLRFQRVESKWLSIKESEIWNLPQDGNPILPALRLSYYNLPLEFRRCFAYCAFFPKGSKIEKGNLIRLWMANGYISRKDKQEVLGDHIWSELCWRSFFQRLDKPETETYRSLTSKRCEKECEIWFKMHDLVHDLAQYIIKDERHMMEYRGSSDTSDRKVRQVSIRMLREGDQATYSPFQPDKCDFRKFGSLRVFEARGIQMMKLPSSIDKLKHLRYLDISGSEINHLPNSICTLWNLQTLILDRCRHLKRLPNNMKCLRNLRHLHLSSCSLMEMPPEIGQLTCLKELSLFVVGKNKGCHLSELQHLNLGGVLRIEHLERVKNPMDAKEANLVGKHNLRMLILCWEDNDESESQENVEELIEALEPHPNIEKLVIKNYYGTHLPHWMMDLKNIDLIELRSCKNCLKLPPIGQLPLLRRLSIWSMDKVNYIDDDLPDGGPVRGFPSLEVLMLDNLSSLTGLSTKEGKELFPLLRRMEIAGCSNLSFRSISSLKTLSVVGPCINVVLESISTFESLTSLVFDRNDEAICFPEEVLRNRTLLKSLRIDRFTKLKSLPNGLAHLTALKSLSIHSCHKLKSLPEEGLLGLESLQRLSICNCIEFSSLSEGLQHLVCLESLEIIACPKLVALPEGVKHLKSLQRLQMGGYSDVSVALPETLQHVPALQYLDISYPTLTSLPDWLGNLTTLQSLIISRCPKISSLPASIQRLTGLRRLTIAECSPELARRCEKGKGEDWHKIAHIPQVNVYAPAKPKVQYQVLSCLQGYNCNMMAARSEVVAASVRMHCRRKLVGCSGGCRFE
ncbi:disease resistance protein RGA2-like isoform X2 [Rhododendron vialii]|uniref:disease resistance protein RGA2-like isoform X2 n=1 Tax=Rhododendron vialii TaxID=182163 RepID=UPI00265D9E4A|nr:disease resistance protein RGA2-like isoform X2 [Rhododendron vialii]